MLPLLQMKKVGGVHSNESSGLPWNIKELETLHWRSLTKAIVMGSAYL